MSEEFSTPGGAAEREVQQPATGDPQPTCPRCLLRSKAEGPDDPHTPLCAHRDCYRVSDYPPGFGEDDNYATEICQECSEPATETVCPCSTAYDKDICSACWEECKMDDSHFEGCEVLGCNGSGIINVRLHDIATKGEIAVEEHTPLGELALALASAKRDGEYILPSEVRVEQGCIYGAGEYFHPHEPLEHCDGRGWIPLDWWYLGEWMVALANVLPSLKATFTSGAGVDCYLTWDITTDDDNPKETQADALAETPEESFFQAALRAVIRTDDA